MNAYDYIHRVIHRALLYDYFVCQESADNDITDSNNHNNM